MIQKIDKTDNDKKLSTSRLKVSYYRHNIYYQIGKSLGIRNGKGSGGVHFINWIVAIIFVWWKGDWRHWGHYYPTMLYIICMNLFYNLICAGFTLWQYVPMSFLKAPSLIDMVYCVIVLPGIALIYLTHLPKIRVKIISYTLKWVIISTVVEIILLQLNTLEYDHGWNIGWSFFLYILMYPMLLLHFKKPQIAILLSIPIIIAFIWIFKVPVNVPMIERGSH